MNNASVIDFLMIFIFLEFFYFSVIPHEESVSNYNSSSLRPAVYKKRPVTLTSSSKPSIIIRNEAPERSVINEDLSKLKGKLNPVKEMQILAKQNSNSEDVCLLHILFILYFRIQFN